MRGSEFVLSLPNSGGDEVRDDAIVRAVEAEHYAPLVWKRIRVHARGLEAFIWVMHDALMLGEPGDYVRVSMNADTAQRIAWHLGAYLPTTKICDAVWDATEARLSPVTQGPPEFSYDGMDAPDRMLNYDQSVEAQVAELVARGKLIGNIGKHWVLSNKATAERAANYGWYVSSGGSVSRSGRRMIQTLGTRHNGRHADYSQVLRLVKDEVELNGKVYRFSEVALDPEFCALISDEGVLRSLYVPTAKKWRPEDEQSYAIADDRTPLTPREGARRLDIRRLLYRGISPGSDVAAWQRFIKVTADSRFGPVTEGATKQFQREHGLVVDGIVGPNTVRKAKEVIAETGELPTPPDVVISFKQAKNFTWANRHPGDVKWIVLHSMESPEKPTMAEAVAGWFAGPDAPRASAHFCVDNDSIVQSVKCENVAWHAPGANRHGIGIEHAGRARQTRADWFDDFSRDMLLHQSAPLCAQLCKLWAVPAEVVGVDGLREGRPGITTHHEVSQAFGKSSHWDPGPGFPMDWYLNCVLDLL